MPVTTRTRRAKPQTTKQSLAKEDVDGYWSSELSDPEEDTSDWEDKRRKRPSGSPQKKRARRNIAGSGSANSKVRGTTIKLSKFPTLPLDIIFEILSLLTPTDLANLAQTNTAFRSTLASPHASNVWKAARKRTGAPKCQECGVSNVHHLDFALRRRVCKKCKKQKLVYVGFFAKRYPGFNPAMLELIPHTNSCVQLLFTDKFKWY
ncbi:hypothetical protein EVJ58_g3181 [Rhodofomes roseus]|uniref:F-box domain-containing protein n=1 Tax=Rhodofomes roseus TaxID=34475 RepID=A0A4Y9YMF1_9APHY|nr:hypothetical protein EVJ58_g3181 [Rhodofomes roseus]